MYLKSLEIKGFKSFADNTHIEFMPGINVIVGPNGCGKSNLVDAVRWVLGEQNVRNLRGQKLDDIIFTGSEKKKALSMASVSLTIDNSDGLLSVPYSEITVNRRVYRTEQSEFYINHKQVRLKDIVQLFSGTGIGKKGYAIIGQGEIENLLSSRPHDIRLMLEEASGIIRFRYQKEEAAERLENIGRDLDRISDLLAEIGQRKEELKHKAEKAARFQDLAQELKEIKLSLLKSEWLQLKKDIEKTKGYVLSYGERQTNLETQIEEIGREKGKLEVVRNELTSKEQQLKEDIYAGMRRLDQIEAEIGHITDRLAELAGRIAESEKEERRFSDLVQQLGDDINSVKDELAAEEGALQELRSEIEHNVKDRDELSSQHKESQKHLEDLKNELVARAQELARIRNNRQSSDERLRVLEEKKTRLRMERAEREESLEEAKKLLDQRAREIEEHTERLTECLDLYRKARHREEELKRDLKEKERAFNSAERKRTELENQIHSLKAMLDAHAGLSESVRALLKNRQQAQGFMPGFIGVISDVIDVPSDLTTAIETALGRGMENLVVETEDDARQGIEFLKKGKLGRATFLPLSLLKPEKIHSVLVKQTGVLGVASELVGCEERVKPAVDFLLGRILIVKDLDTAIRLQKTGKIPWRMVTLEGELLIPGGAISGGKGKNISSPITYRKRIKELNQEVETLRAAENDLKKAWEGLNLLLGKIMEEGKNLLQRADEYKYRRQLLDEEIRRITKDIEGQKARLKEIELNERMLLTEISDVNQQMAEDSVQLRAKEEEVALLEQQLERVKQETDDILRRLEVGKERAEAVIRVLDTRELKLKALYQQKDKLEELRAGYEDAARRQRDKRSVLSREREDKLNKLDQLKKERATLEIEVARFHSGQQEVKQKIVEIDGRVKVLNERIAVLAADKGRCEDRKKQYELKLARLEAEFAICERGLEQEQIEENNEPLDEKTRQELAKRQEELEKLLDALGPVDLGSIEEYRLTSERYELLFGQHTDLTSARSDLLKLIRKTEQTLKEDFASFLSEASASFAMTFGEIFDGGEAALRLTEDDEEGVEIVVKMPGKKRQSLSMLSGGERSLTCIALMFSLLKLKPVPFCFLDEIDAALDEVNLQRFTRYLQKMADETQFIIISHRQGTIEIGQNLYGITMAEGGVSTVLSLKLNEDAELAG